MFSEAESAEPHAADEHRGTGHESRRDPRRVQVPESQQAQRDACDERGDTRPHLRVRNIGAGQDSHDEQAQRVYGTRQQHHHEGGAQADQQRGFDHARCPAACGQQHGNQYRDRGDLLPTSAAEGVNCAGHNERQEYCRRRHGLAGPPPRQDAKCHHGQEGQREVCGGAFVAEPHCDRQREPHDNEPHQRSPLNGCPCEWPLPPGVGCGQHERHERPHNGPHPDCLGPTVESHGSRTISRPGLPRSHREAHCSAGERQCGRRPHPVDAQSGQDQPGNARDQQRHWRGKGSECERLAS